jgi:O-antigen/teichoic acid export membrane protein
VKIFRSSFVQSLLALLSVHAGTLLGGTLLPIAMARIVGAEALGIFTTASSFGLLLLAVIDWGYETRLPLLISQTPDSLYEHIITAQGVKLRLWLLATTIFGVGYGVVSLLAQNSAAPLQSAVHLILPLVLYSVWALVRGMASTYSHALRGLQQFGAIARVENSLTLASHLLAVGILMLPFVRSQTLSPVLVVSAVIACLIVSEIAKSLVFMRYLRQNYRRDSVPVLRGNIPFSIEHLMFVAMQALGILQSRAGIYTLTLLATQTEVGYFSAVIRFTIALRILPGALFTVLLPRFVRSQDSETLGKALLAGLLIGTLGSVILYTASGGLIWLIYGERFAHLAPILRLVAWLFLLQTLLNILEPYLLAHKAERFVNGTLAIALCAFAGICVLLPVNTARMAAVMSLGLECVLVVIYGIKSLTLLPQKKSA